MVSGMKWTILSLAVLGQVLASTKDSGTCRTVYTEKEVCETEPLEVCSSTPRERCEEHTEVHCSPYSRRRRAALEDENLCSDASPESGRYLVRDPADCRMFYSCTPAEEAGQFIPHRVACPEGTAFDVEIQVCVHDDIAGPCELPQGPVSALADVIWSPASPAPVLETRDPETKPYFSTSPAYTSSDLTSHSDYEQEEPLEQSTKTFSSSSPAYTSYDLESHSNYKQEEPMEQCREVTSRRCRTVPDQSCVQGTRTTCQIQVVPEERCSPGALEKFLASVGQHIKRVVQKA